MTRYSRYSLRHVNSSRSSKKRRTYLLNFSESSSSEDSSENESSVQQPVEQEEVSGENDYSEVIEMGEFSRSSQCRNDEWLNLMHFILLF